MTAPAFMNLGLGEMLVIGLIALLVFGGRLPEAMRNLGRSYARFREGMNELSRPIREEMRGLDTHVRRASSLAASSAPPPRPPPPATLPPVRREPPTPYTAGAPAPVASADREPAPGPGAEPPRLAPAPGGWPGKSAGAADEPPPV